MKNFFSNKKHIVFDLDHTLWDTEYNIEVTLKLLFDTHQLYKRGIEKFDFFKERYIYHNDLLWEQYAKGNVDKITLRKKRMLLTLLDFNINDEMLSATLESEFVKICPTMQNLLPNSIDILEILAKDYQLHILTNGFKESQIVKLESSGISHFFKSLICSEDAGFNKPDIRIFKHAEKKINASYHEILYFGDNYEVDILGGIFAKWDCIYFNSKSNISDYVPQINSWKQMIDILS